MNYVSVPPLVAPSDKGSLSDLPARNGASQPLGVAFCTPSAGTWADVTNAEFLAEVRSLAKGLMASGIGPGERVAIMSRTRYEWALTDFAIWTAGGVSVPIYETSSALQVDWIVRDSGCAAVILETPTDARVLGEVESDLPELRHVWQIDAGGLDQLRAAGSQISDDHCPGNPEHSRPHQDRHRGAPSARDRHPDRNRRGGPDQGPQRPLGVPQQ